MRFIPSLVLALFMMTGCASYFSSGAPPQYYKIDYATSAPDCPAGWKQSVRVWPFSASAPYDREEMIILDADHKVRFSSVYRWVAVPDPYFAWIGPAVLKGRETFARERFDAILSSSPRASAHLAAAVLSEHAGLPWLADYRDPWSTYQFRQYPTRAHKAAHERLEAWALRRATAVTAVNRPIVDDLVARHPWLDGRVHVLPNGFDRAEQPADVRLGDGFWIVHTGRLYGREQQVAAFLEALAAQPPEVKALFVGVDESRVRPDAGRLGLGDRVRVEPLVPLPVALGYQIGRASCRERV